MEPVEAHIRRECRQGPGQVLLGSQSKSGGFGPVTLVDLDATQDQGYLLGGLGDDEGVTRGGGGVSRLLVDPRPPRRLHYPLDLLGHPAGCPSDHPVPVLPLPLDIEILEPPAVEGRDHGVPQIFRELVGADRPQTPVQNGILDPPP